MLLTRPEKSTCGWFKTTYMPSEAVNTKNPETMLCLVLPPPKEGGKVGIMFNSQEWWGSNLSVTHHIELHNGQQYGYARIQVRIKHDGNRVSTGLDPFDVRSDRGKFILSQIVFVFIIKCLICISF